VRLDTARSKVGRIEMTDVQNVVRSQVPAPASQATIDELQAQRSDLVEQYVGARPEGSNGWKVGVGIGTGAVAAGIGIGAVLLANRGKGAMYQGFNLMFGLPMALGVGGGVGYLLGARAGELASRPQGDAAAAQVTATREQLRDQITDLDQQLTAADGRRPQPLPEIDDSASVSLGRVGMHAAAGFGLGLLGTAGVMGGFEALQGGRQMAGGPTFAAALVAPAVAAGAISYLDQRDEAAGRQGSFLRAAGIGAATMGAATLMPAFAGIPMPLRIAGGAAVGALVGSAVHMVSASSRD
jgi:hypothetical protein